MKPSDDLNQSRHTVSNYDDEAIIDNENTMNVNLMSVLKPELALIIELQVGNSNVKALVDTGASISLITNSLYKVHSNKSLSSKTFTIFGLNETKITTKGGISLNVNYFGRGFDAKFEVVEDQDINYPVILGMDFLQENNISINLMKRKITKHNSDRSSTSVYLTADGSIRNIVHENIPIYSKHKLVVKKNEVASVEVTTDINNFNDPELNCFYVEMDTNSNNLNAMNGILDFTNESTFMYASASSDSKTRLVKAGEVIGRGSTLLTIESDDQPEEWTLDRLKAEVPLTNTHLNDSQTHAVYQMLLNSRDALSVNNADIGQAVITPHHIDLTNNTPIWQTHRSFSEPVNREIDKQCQELLSNDIIEYSNSEWSSPVVPVRKKDGTLRLCIDYRKVNQVTETQHFPMPNLAHDVYKAHNVNYFSKLDLTRGYYQVPLDEESRPITAFSTAHDHFQFKRLSFGLKNSGIAFQKIIQQVLSPIMNENIVIYIDDILIMSESFDKHLELVSKVLCTLYLNNMKVNVSKCELFQSQVKFWVMLLVKMEFVNHLSILTK